MSTPPDTTLAAPEIEWPNEIWAKERGEHDQTGEHVYSVFATVARWEGDREGQYHRYVDGDTLDSLKKYHAALIENGQLITIADHLAAVQAAVVKAVEACAEICDNDDPDIWDYSTGNRARRGESELGRQIRAAIRSRGVAG